MPALNFPINPNDGDEYDRFIYNAAKGVWVTSTYGQVVAGSNSFSTVDTPDGTNPVATSATDILTFLAGSNISIAGNQATDSVTIAATGLALSTHTHNAADIYSGVLDISRIPTGVSSATVSIGDHTHDDRYYTESEVATLLAALVPAGTLNTYAGSTAPSGYLFCRGQQVSRSAYSTLFGVIGTTYGAGDGSTTFTIPDMRGVVPVGKADSGTFVTLNASGGAETHTLTESQMPSHAHTSYFGTGNYNAGSAYSLMRPVAFNVGTGTSATGGSGSHNNLQPYRVLNYIIKT